MSIEALLPQNIRMKNRALEPKISQSVRYLYRGTRRELREKNHQIKTKHEVKSRDIVKERLVCFGKKMFGEKLRHLGRRKIKIYNRK